MYFGIYKKDLRLEQFKYLGETLTNKNSIQEETESKLKTGNSCYHSVQNRLSSSLLSNNIKIEVHRTIIVRAFSMGVKYGRSYGGRNVV
jgi:hypothetical protein